MNTDKHSKPMRDFVVSYKASTVEIVAVWSGNKLRAAHTARGHEQVVIQATDNHDARCRLTRQLLKS